MSDVLFRSSQSRSSESKTLAHSQPRVAIVVGMTSEARIAAVGRDLTVIGGGSAAQVEAGLTRLHRQAREEGRPLQGVVSFGVAGGLCPQLRPGHLFAPEVVRSNGAAFPCHVEWTGHLARTAPDVRTGVLLGVDAPVLTPAHKRRLHRKHGAHAVDMESHGAARFASANGLPFAALRAVADPQHRVVPPAAMAGFRPDGSADALAVLAALVRSPSQTAALIRTALDAKAALAALLGGRRMLGSLFGFDQVM